MRNSFAVHVGNIAIGGKNPVVVQSMTDTATADIENTVLQIQALYRAGSELVRIPVNDEPAAQAVPIIKKQLQQQGFDVPLVVDVGSGADWDTGRTPFGS